MSLGMETPRGNPRSSGYARAELGFYTEPIYDWNLSKKLVLDEALGNWRAMRSFNGGYRAQLAMFDDDCARRHEFREKIDALIKEPCGHNRDHIVSINVRSREHYHPGRPRSECDKALLRRMLDDTLLGGLSAAA